MPIRRFSRFFRDPRGILAGIYLAFAIMAQFLPLVGDLHYEFSAACAVLASLCAGIAAIYRPRQQTIRDERYQPVSGHVRPLSGSSAQADELWRMVSGNVLLCLIPLPVAYARGLFGGGCGLMEGLSWYLLLVPPAAAISTVLAAFSERMTRRRWLSLLLFLLLWLAGAARGAYEGYSGPHIFLYAWQIGFFPGGSWDAELPISPLLLLYRATHLLVAAALAVVTLELGKEHDSSRTWHRGGLLALGSMIAATGLILVAARADLGLTRTHHWLRSDLGDSLRTRFATIYYHAPSTDSLTLWRAANLTDFYIADLGQALGIPESGIEPITIYLYASPDEEKRLVGTSSAAFTKPWARTLNMSFASVGSTLRHELAHVMIAPYGNPLGISMSQGLVEGSAMALENDYLWRTLHQYARMMYAFDLAPPAEGIISIGGFSSRRTSVSYVLAGSFSRWLIERYGMPRYLKAFPWADFEAAYGKSLHQLSSEYQGFIDSLPPPDASGAATARYLFGGGSFFLQKCLRRIGTLNAAGYQALAEERYGLALERFRHSIGEGINYGARAGVLRSLAGLGRYRELLDSSAVYAQDTASYPLLPYLIERGDAWWALGDTAAARQLYDSVLALDISRTLSLRAALRVRFMEADTALAPLLRSYFTRPMRRTQRLLVLADAAATATTPEDRLILAMMHAALAAPELPITSMQSLASSVRHLPIGTEPVVWLEQRISRIDRFIIASLAADLAPAAQYAAGAGAGGIGMPILDAARRLGPQGLLPGSLEYQKEGDDILRRFEHYLTRYSILPGTKDN